MQLSIIELYTLYYPNILIYLNILMLDEHSQEQFPSN